MPGRTVTTSASRPTSAVRANLTGTTKGCPRHHVGHKVDSVDVFGRAPSTGRGYAEEDGLCARCRGEVGPDAEAAV